MGERQAEEPDQPSREIAQRVLAATDRARRKLARDLHDGAQQKFVTAVINLQLAQSRFSSDPQRAERHLETALRQATAGLDELREFVSGIHPPVLVHLGLSAAVGSLADGFPIPLELDITDRRLPAATEESVYFFISEALANVAKHAHANVARIRVVATITLLTVEVSDDGIGGATMTVAGSGMIGLADRVEALGGDFAFESPPSSGTVVRGTIPLPAELL